MGQSLPSKSWQEITLMYEVYGARLVELARLKKVFHFHDQEIDTCTVFTMDGSFEVAKSAFDRDVDETDGMLVLLDAEIARRNSLIGVMG